MPEVPGVTHMKPPIAIAIAAIAFFLWLAVEILERYKQLPITPIYER